MRARVFNMRIGYIIFFTPMKIIHDLNRSTLIFFKNGDLMTDYDFILPITIHNTRKDVHGSSNIINPIDTHVRGMYVYIYI